MSARWKGPTFWTSLVLMEIATVMNVISTINYWRKSHVVATHFLPVPARAFHLCEKDCAKLKLPLRRVSVSTVGGPDCECGSDE